MPRKKKCCVCDNLRKDAILYRFPCGEKRLNLWLKWLRKRYEINKPSPEMYVCEQQFEKKFITPKSRLVGKAYPSLFTEEEIRTGTPSTDNTENDDPHRDSIVRMDSNPTKIDHTYCQTPLQEKNMPRTSSSVAEMHIPGPSTSKLPGRQHMAKVSPKKNIDLEKNMPLPSSSIAEMHIPGPSTSKLPGRGSIWQKLRINFFPTDSIKNRNLFII